MKVTFRDSAPSRRTISRWFQQFRAGENQLGRQRGSGRRPTAVTKTIIAAVDRIITENPRATYSQIEHEEGIGSSSVKTILHEKLRLRKLCAKWVPHGLTATQKEARKVFAADMLSRFSSETPNRLREIVTGDETWAYYHDPETKLMSMEWVRPGQERPTKVRRQRSVKKTMLIVFFDCSGIVSKSKMIPRPGRRTVNALFYTKTCLTNLVKALWKKRPKSGTRGIFLHHDNASAHTAGLTKNFLNDNQLRLLPHPPYSPDLAPCDFFLFPKLKEKLKGITFQTERQLTCAISKALKCLSENGFFHVFEQWLDRCKKCVERNGEYIEKFR